jgi:hypothetical protein
MGMKNMNINLQIYVAIALIASLSVDPHQRPINGGMER